jgi:hypothetical protein
VVLSDECTPLPPPPARGLRLSCERREQRGSARREIFRRPDEAPARDLTHA